MAQPLSARVPAPADPIRPSESGGLRWRPAAPADLDAILDLEAAIAAADHPRYVSSREDVAENFERSHIAPELDTLLAERDGELVAWGVAELNPAQESLVSTQLYGGVRPNARGQGIGRQLLGWQEARGLQQLAASESELPGWLSVFADEHATATHRLLERSGFGVARYFLELRRDLDEPVAPRPLPEGMRLEPYTEDLWEATRQARNEAFQDHWGSQPVTEERWLGFARREVSRPNWSFVALGEDDDSGWNVVAFVLAQANEQDWPLQGFTSAYVDLVGTRKAWRGRGLAAALLTATMRAVAADGIESVLLDVDSESPTGAVGLYSGLGFTETARTVSYTKVF